MAKRQKRQPVMKTQPTLTPQQQVARLLMLVRPSLESILSMVAAGRAGAALEMTFLYGCAQGIRIARQDMKGAKQIEKAIDEVFGEQQVEVDVKGKTMEEAQEEVRKAARPRPTIWTPRGEM